MKLREVKIHNFRSILDTTILLRDYTLLVGPNNSGKSTVIDAIRAFYEKDGFKFSKDRDFPKLTTKDNESWVELAFCLTPSEREHLPEEYRTQNSQLRVRRILHKSEQTSSTTHKEGHYYICNPDGSLSDKPFPTHKDVHSGRLGNVVYIPAISTLDEHTKLSGRSPLRDLLTELVRDAVSHGEAYANFVAAVGTFDQAIQGAETSEERSLAGLKREINRRIAQWDSEFTLNLVPPSPEELVKYMIKWHLFDRKHNCEINIDACGSGFQRYFIYSVIDVASQYATRNKVPQTEDFNPTFTLILFEEPEAFLHPPQQEQLAADLRRLSTREGWQIICTTHSPCFVSKNANDIPSIVRFSHAGNGVTKYQVTEDDWDRIVRDNQRLNVIAQKYPDLMKSLDESDFKSDMEAIKYFIWLNPARAGAFFAEHVLLVEGPTEVALINRLISDGKISNVRAGLYIMDCMGKFNIHRFMNLFSSLGIDHSVIYDDDKNKEWHTEINKLIHDSQNEKFTRAIECIPGRLEELLGISEKIPQHRKPQRVLFHYESGNINPDGLQRFCQHVNKCLAT